MKSFLFVLILALPPALFADAVVFDNAADAKKFQTAIDADKGYPKQGDAIGKGIHASGEESKTIHHTAIIKHPTLEKYAVQSDDVKPSTITDTKIAPSKLASDWKGASVKDSSTIEVAAEAKAEVTP